MDTNIHIHICRCICRHAHKHTCTHACIHTQTHHEDIRPQKWGWTCIRLLSLFVSELHMLLLLVYSLIHSPTHCTFCLLLFLKLLLPFHSILCHYDLSVIKRTFIQLVLPSFTPSFVHLLWSPIIIPLHSIRHLLLQACPWSTRPTHSCGCLFAHGLSCNYILISTCVHSLHDTYMSGYMYDQTYEPTSLHAGWAINLVITNFMSCCFRLLTHYIMCHPTPCIKCIRSFIHFINPSIYCQSSTRANLSHSPMPLVCTHTCAHIARHIPSIITDWTHT